MYNASQLLEMQEELQRLQASSADIEATALITMDGLILASTLPGETEEDRVSALSASLLMLAERMTLELGRGCLEQVFVRGAEGDVLLMAVADKAVLAILSRREAKLGMLIYYMRRASKELTNFLN